VGTWDTAEALRGSELSDFHQRSMLICHPPPQEIKPGMIELMKPEYTLAQSEIQGGDIICFQVDVSSQGAHKFKSQRLCSNPQQFYKVLRNRVTD
jgi:hypothetical protein